MNKLRYFTFLILIFNIHFLIAQEESRTEEDVKNTIVISGGVTYIPEGSPDEEGSVEAHYVPSIGLDYFRRIHKRWEIGIMSDLELNSYHIPEEGLVRENAFILTGIATFNATSRWNIFLGGGIELEKNEHLSVLRLGTEYIQPLPKEWFIPFTFLYDLKEEYSTWTISVGVGKEF